MKSIFPRRLLMGAGLLVGSLSFAGVGHAQDANHVPDTQSTAYLKNIGARLALIDSHPDIGLDGYISDVKGKKTTVYLLTGPNGGRYFMVGSLFDANGNNLTLKSVSDEEQKLTDAIRQLKNRTEAADQITKQQQDAFGDVKPIAAPVSDNPLPVSAAPALQVPSGDSETAKVASLAADSSNTEDLSGQWVNDKITQGVLRRDVERTAYFYEGNENDPVVYLVADPQCPYCHAAWGMLSSLMAQHHFSVRVILTGVLPGSDALVTQLLANSDVVQVWQKGAGSKDGVPVPNAVTVGSKDWQAAEQYRNMNAAFAKKYRAVTGTSPQSNGVPILMYAGKDGKIRSMQGIYTGKEKLDAMKAFLSGLPNWHQI